MNSTSILSLVSYDQLKNVLFYLAIATAVNFLISQLVRRSFPSFKIGSVGWLALSDLEWGCKAGTTIKIGRIGLNFGAPGFNRYGKRGWIILKLSGVKVKLPKQVIFLPSESAAHPDIVAIPTDRQNDTTLRPPLISNLSKLIPSSLSTGYIFCKLQILPVVVAILNYIGGILSRLVALLAIELDLAIELEEICIVAGVIRGGGDLTGASDSRLRAWVGLDHLVVTEWSKKDQGKDERRLPAIEMNSLLAITFGAPLDSSIGLSGLIRSRGTCLGFTKACIDVGINFANEGEGVKIRTQQVETILADFETAKANVATAHSSTVSLSPPTQSISPLSLIRSFSISLPLLTISANYTTTLPSTTSPRSMGCSMSLEGFKLDCLVGGTSNILLSRNHRVWLGKDRTLGFEAKANWDGMKVGITLDGTPARKVIGETGNLISIGPSAFSVTSTWSPLALIWSTNVVPGMKDLNDDIVILSLVIGDISGRTNFTTIDHALRIYQSRPKFARRSASKSPATSPATITGLPVIVSNLSCGGIDLRTHGPEMSEEKLERRKNSKLDQFYLPWTSLDSLCLASSPVSASFTSEYSDRSVQRTDMERRILKKEAKEEAAELERRTARKPTGVEQDGSENNTPSPPLLSRPSPRLKQTRPIYPADLDEYPVQFSSNFSLSTDTLSIFILSSDVDDFETPEEVSTRLDILSLGPVFSTISTGLSGTLETYEKNIMMSKLDRSTHKTEVSIAIKEIGIELWQPVVATCLGDFARSFAAASASSTIRPTIDAPSPRPLVDILPIEFGIYISVEASSIRLAGVDKQAKSDTVRGITLHSGAIVFEYLQQRILRPSVINYPHRQLLELREDIRVEANLVVAERPDISQALFKLTLNGFHLDPLVNARESMKVNPDLNSNPSRKPSLAMPADWELRNRGLISDLARRKQSILHTRVIQAAEGIIYLPEIAFRCRLQADSSGETLDAITLSTEADKVTLHIDVFHSYLCLLALSTLLSVLPQSLARSPAASPSVSPPVRRPSPKLNLRLEIIELQFFLTLPQKVKLFGQIRRLRALGSKSMNVTLDWDTLLVAGTSPTVLGKWDDLVRSRSTTLRIEHSPNNEGSQPFTVALESESARLRIPFRYAFSTIIDNAIEFTKSTKQLVHQFVKGKDDLILNPLPEKAKRLPRIDLNIKMFAVEIQDDPFETRLNIIWRVGYEEQIARLERSNAFDVKVEGLNASKERDGQIIGEESREGGRQNSRPQLTARQLAGIESARAGLRSYDASHWVKRMRNAVAEQGRREEALTRRLYGIRQHIQARSLLPIDLLPISRSAPLARTSFQNLQLSITKPAFDNLPDFMHDVGKGLPRDTSFSLLVPFHISWKMEEARCQLRDYPLPLLHIPPMSEEGHDFAAWECEMDLVIAEEIGNVDSIRRAPCIIVPDSITQSGAYCIMVPRSAMTVKSYSNPTVIIRSPFATRIGWGNSIQPAIQDVAKVLDSLSKSSPDPSERMGFWDKLRLQFHWRVKVSFQGEGPLHFHLKGTRDPYALTGFGAGFSKAWQGNVELFVGFDNEAKEFFQIESEEYILGIPNLREYVDSAATGMVRIPTESDDRSTQYSAGTDGGTGSHGRGRFSQDADFIKVCAKFINGVRWGMGAVLERSCRSECSNALCIDQTPFHRQCRTFDFKPHWEVRTKTADAEPGPDGTLSDSFAGFRSDFIHFSISLISPLLLDPPPSSTSPESSSPIPPPLGYNSLHFSPQASTHFWTWWKLFDGSMSLPIRQGKLFPSAQPSSKKFGKHCATIKYRFSLAPLFISHTYRQETWSEWSRGETTVVGLKGKVGRFNVDLHQREQEETIKKPNSKETKVVKRKVFYQAEVDCDGVDLRVISACFQEPEKRAIIPEEDQFDHEDEPRKREGNVADEDLEWVDLDDFIDAVYTIPDENPSIQVLPLVKCPRFTYYRKIGISTPDDPTEGVESIAPKSKFGSESSHSCLMGCATDTITVQIQSANLRLTELEASLSQYLRSDAKDGPEEEIHLRIRSVRRIIARLVHLRAQNLASNSVVAQSESIDDSTAAEPPTDNPIELDTEDQGSDAHLPHINSHLYQEWGEWENRYMIHNPTIHISNSTREVLLKYYYSSRDRRGFVYHLSASAIKFIRDLMNEQMRPDPDRPPNWPRRKSTMNTLKGKEQKKKGKDIFEEALKTNRLLDELINGINDGQHKSTDRTDKRSFGDALDVDPESAANLLPDSYDLQSGHLCVFIKPQIALQSDLDDKSTVILTAFRAELKIFSVVDLTVLDDQVNSQVLHQTFARLDGLQAFYPRRQLRRDSDAFVPLETLVDLRIEPWGFDRIVPRTSASLRYDKFNQLRMSSLKGSRGDSSSNNNDSKRNGVKHESHFRTGTDRISVEIDKFSVSANPDHFAAIYNVVSDLLLYSDPIQKKRNIHLEAVVFTHDFTNLSGVTDTVISLQQRIRSLGEILQQYQVHLDELDDQGRVQLFVTRADFARLSYELTLMMMSITRAQDSNGGKPSKTAGVHFEARASELVWHMLDHTDTPIAKFSVNGVEFSWISKQDASTSSRLVIKDLEALNSSPTQVFAEIISKLEGANEHDLAKVGVFAAILWNSLAPVGGITIIEQFELHLHPIRLQLEHGIGRKIMDYIFSQRGRNDTIEDKRKNVNAVKDEKEVGGKRQSIGTSISNRSSDSLLRPISKRPLSTRSSNASIRNQSSSAPSSTFASLVSSSVGSELNRFKKVASSDSLAPQRREEGLDAVEMRMRAALNKTFVLIDITATVLCLTYRSEKADHSRLPDIYNITYRTPAIQYRSKTWSYLNLLEALKRDVIKSAWKQSGALLGQLLKKAHRKFPLSDARSAAKKSLKDRLSGGRTSFFVKPSSPLRRIDSRASGQSTIVSSTLDSDSEDSEDESRFLEAANNSATRDSL